jgi:hypothetical protein
VPSVLRRILSQRQCWAPKWHSDQLVFSHNAGQVSETAVAQTQAEALEWVWKDYAAPMRRNG